jgi:hypothetical protein
VENYHLAAVGKDAAVWSHSPREWAGHILKG